MKITSLNNLTQSIKVRILSYVLCITIVLGPTSGFAKPWGEPIVHRSIKAGSLLSSGATLGLMLVSYQKFEEMKNRISELKQDVWFFPPMDFGTDLNARSVFETLQGLKAQSIRGSLQYETSLGSLQGQIQLSQNAIISEMVFAGLFGAFYLGALPFDLGDLRFAAVATTTFLWIYSLGISAANTSLIVGPAGRMSDSLIPLQDIPAVDQSEIPQKMNAIFQELNTANQFCWSTLAMPAGSFLLFPLFYYGIEKAVIACRAKPASQEPANQESLENAAPRPIERFRDWNNRMSARGENWVNRGATTFRNSARDLVAIPVAMVWRGPGQPPNVETAQEVPAAEVNLQTGSLENSSNVEKADEQRESHSSNYKEAEEENQLANY